MYARTATVAITLALVGAVVAGAHASAAEPAVSCDRIVLRDHSGTKDGFRLLLEAVSVPGSTTPGARRRCLGTGSANAGCPDDSRAAAACARSSRANAR